MAIISSKYQKDFKDQDFRNPRLVRDAESKKKRWKLVLSCLGAVAVAWLLYFLFFSQYFKIRTVELNGLEKIKDENLRAIVNSSLDERQWIFRQNNYWLFDTDKLNAKIREHYLLEKLTIKKSWPNKLNVDLIEKSTAITWLANNVCYELDLTGAVIGFCENGRGLISITDLHNRELKINDKAIVKEKLAYLIEINDRIDATLDGRMNLVANELNDDFLTLKMETGPRIEINTNMKARDQADRLARLLQEDDVKNELLKFEYIDLRFGEKVYFK